MFRSIQKLRPYKPEVSVRGSSSGARLQEAKKTLQIANSKTLWYFYHNVVSGIKLSSYAQTMFKQSHVELQPRHQGSTWERSYPGLFPLMIKLRHNIIKKLWSAGQWVHNKLWRVIWRNCQFTTARKDKLKRCRFVRYQKYFDILSQWSSI